MFLTIINSILSISVLIFAIDTGIKLYEANYIMLIMSFVGSIAYIGILYLIHMDDVSDIRFNWRQWVLITIGSYIVSILLVHFTVMMTYSI